MESSPIKLDYVSPGPENDGPGQWLDPREPQPASVSTAIFLAWFCPCCAILTWIAAVAGSGASVIPACCGAISPFVGVLAAADGLSQINQNRGSQAGRAKAWIAMVVNLAYISLMMLAIAVLVLF